MRTTTRVVCAGVGSCLLGAAVAAAQSSKGPARGPFQFTPLAASAQCVDAAPPPAPAGGGAGTYPNEQPFVLPEGYTQTVFAREGDGGTTDNWDMNTLNETGPHAGRFSIA